MAKSGLMNLAKGNGKKIVSTAKKTVEKKEVEKPVITPAEERDQKAKARVEELLQNVPMTLDEQEKKEELLEVVDEPKSIEWLEEQLQLLADANQNLKAEAELAKGDYQRILAENQILKGGGQVNSNDGQVAENVLRLFLELQDALFSMGINQNTNQPNLIIYPVAFLNKLIVFFPFLGQYRKF